MMDDSLTPTAYALGGGIGLLLMGYASNTYFWYSYQQANPAVGEVSTSAGITVVTAAVFLLGAFIAFSAFSKGFVSVLADANGAESGRSSGR